MNQFALYQKDDYVFSQKIFRGIFDSRELALKAVHENRKSQPDSANWHIEIVTPNIFINQP